MHSITAEINLRPVRIGFLVDPTDASMVSRVIRVATCLWGGMMSPIIPISKRLPKPWRDHIDWGLTAGQLTTGLLEFFEPDAFVQTAEGQFEKAGLTTDLSWWDRGRFQSLETLVRADPGRAPIFNLGLSMDHIYEQLFIEEFQFKKRMDPRILHFEGGSPADMAFFEACYGAFPVGEPFDSIRASYEGAFAAQKVAPDIETWSAIERREAGFPLYYTTRGLDQRFERDWSESVYIFDPCSPTDLIDFWNYRLFTREVVPVNVHWLEQSRDFIIKLIRQNYRPLPSNSFGVMIGTNIRVGRSLDIEKVQQALDLSAAALPEDSASLSSGYPAIWMRPREEHSSSPIVAPLSARRQEIQVVPDEGSRVIRVPLLSPSGVDFVRSQGPGWVNVVQPRTYSEISIYAEAVPSAAITANESYPCPHFVTAIPTREGYVMSHQFAHDGVSFPLVTRQEAVLQWLKGQGIKTHSSDAGRVADELIASVSGVTGSVILAHAEAIVQFDKMARSRLVREGGDSEEYPDRTATLGQLTAMMKKIQAKPFGSHITLKHYVDAGVLRLGVAVRCTHCTKENWYSLDDIASTIRCERCLKSFDYPQGEPPSLSSWKYRVVGPFATPHYAQGAYCVALTLRFLKHGIGSLDAFTYMTSLDLKVGDKQLETDFFAWHGQRGNSRNPADPVLLVGECKSFGTELFKAKDVARLRELGEQFPGAFLVAATLKTTLSRAEIAGLRSLARWGWRRAKVGRPATPLIVLTGTELFAIGPLINAWKDAGGALNDAADRHRDIFDFDTLAVATQEAHLGLDREELFKLRHHPKRPKRNRSGAQR